MGSAGSIVRYTFKINKSGVSYPIADGSSDYIRTQAEGAITAIQMDSNNHEGIFGTSLGNIYYIDLKEPNQMPIKLVTRVSPSLDVIRNLSFDLNNPEIFFCGCGPHSENVKMFTSQSLDQVIDFPVPAMYTSVDPPELRFVAGFAPQSSKDVKQQYRMFGLKNGTLKFIDMNKLDFTGIFEVKLDRSRREELNAGCFSKNGLNFAVGSTCGNVWIGNTKLDTNPRDFTSLSSKPGSRKSMGCNIGKCVGLLKNTEQEEEKFSVSSIQMTDFNRGEGELVVAFTNGVVRVWHS